MRGSPSIPGIRIATSSTKHQDQSSPGWIERMIGCPLLSACAVACRLGDESQQPTWPQLRQMRRWHHFVPSARHSSQPSTALGQLGDLDVSRCVQEAMSKSNDGRERVPAGLTVRP